MNVYDPFELLAGQPAYNTPLQGLMPGSGVAFPDARAYKFIPGGYREVLLFAAAMAFFIFSLSVFLLSLPHDTVAKSRAILPAMAPVVEAASGGSPSLEVHIANNGLVLLRAAKVVSVNGSTLTLSTAWGSSNFIWTVRTTVSSSGKHNYGTQFLDLNGNAEAPGTIAAGDLVTVTGPLDTNAKGPTLDADTVRNLQ